MPLSARDEKVARTLKKRVADLAPLIDFKIFGSRARGDAAADSDMDVYIALESCDREIEGKIQDVAWEVGFDNGCIHISPLIFTRREIEDSPLRASSILRAIDSEGVRVRPIAMP